MDENITIHNTSHRTSSPPHTTLPTSHNTPHLTQHYPPHTTLPTSHNTTHLTQHSPPHTTLPTSHNTPHLTQHYPPHTTLPTLHNTTHLTQHSPPHTTLPTSHMYTHPSTHHTFLLLTENLDAQEAHFSTSSSFSHLLSLCLVWNTCNIWCSLARSCRPLVSSFTERPNVSFSSSSLCTFSSSPTTLGRGAEPNSILYPHTAHSTQHHECGDITNFSSKTSLLPEI